MTTFGQDQDMDRWLAEHCASMIKALDEVIDVEAGLQEVLIPVENAKLIADLDKVVDVEAGLAALLPIPDPILAPARGATSSDLDKALRSISPLQRLALREAFSPLVGGEVLAVAGNIDHSGEKISSLDASFMEQDGYVLVRHELSSTEASASHLRGLTYRCDGTIPDENSIYSRVQWAILSDLGDLSDVISELYEHIDRAEKYLEDARAPLVQAFDVIDCRIQVRGFAEACRQATSRVRALQRFLNDFIGADLSQADLDGMHLVGVRWSLTTLWPSLEWRDRIEQSSIEISDGIYEIGGDESRQRAAVG
ncbi:hypothetical protein [Nocardia niigatensis]|uniref:hypothetical protein n=1 Tax=Nocardia niigatensis TaxID=209249 RepID=UPI000593F23E|nr:hypothetical protein [Nocardia niigatensis]